MGIFWQSAYSKSFYSVIDSLSNLLAPNGLISVADFYVQAATTFSNRTYTGGFLDRHVNWFSRQFWRMWFEFDRVNLDEGRRDYMEYKFGTVLTINDRSVYPLHSANIHRLYITPLLCQKK
jgi:betaine lipid synthase